MGNPPVLNFTTAAVGAVFTAKEKKLALTFAWSRTFYFCKKFEETSNQVSARTVRIPFLSPKCDHYHFHQAKA